MFVVARRELAVRSRETSEELRPIGRENSAGRPSIAQEGLRKWRTRSEDMGDDSPTWLRQELDVLELPESARYRLEKAGVRTVAGLVSLTEARVRRLVGLKGLVAIRKRLAEAGLALHPDPTPAEPPKPGPTDRSREASPRHWAADQLLRRDWEDDAQLGWAVTRAMLDLSSVAPPPEPGATAMDQPLATPDWLLSAVNRGLPIYARLAEEAHGGALERRAAVQIFGRPTGVEAESTPDFWVATTDTIAIRMRALKQFAARWHSRWEDHVRTHLLQRDNERAELLGPCWVLVSSAVVAHASRAYRGEATVEDLEKDLLTGRVQREAIVQGEAGTEDGSADLLLLSDFARARDLAKALVAEGILEELELELLLRLGPRGRSRNGRAWPEG
jgi:hypothetical protein